MKVRLVAYSKPEGEFIDDIDTAKDLVAYCARVSNPANQNNKKTADKLIKYLIKNQHWSPLEMASATLEVETTRDIARQLLRHRSFSFQEFSQRYSSVDDLGDSFLVREARLQDKSNRQNSIETEDTSLQVWWDAKQKFIIEHVKEIYREAIERGIAKEQARCILPEGNTKSRLYVNGTLRSWLHYVDLRSANGTQKEHMELAKACGRTLIPLIGDLDMGREITTHYADDNKGKAVVCIDFKEEMAYIKYYDDNDKFFFKEEFPNKSIRYVEDAAENWALGIKKLEE